MIFAFSLALTAIAVAAVFAAVPSLTARTAPLGVSVPHSHVNDPAVVSAVKSYRRIVLGVGVVAAVASPLAVASPVWVALIPMLMAIAGPAAYVLLRRRIMAAKRDGGWFDDKEFSVAARVSPDSASESQRDLARVIADVDSPRVPVIWYLASALVLGVAAAYVASRWSDIPSTIVTHWGSGLQPDAWADKSVGQVFFPTWIGLGTIALLWLTTLMTSRLMIAVRSDRSVKGQLRSRAALAGMNSGLGFLSLMMSLGLALMQATDNVPGTERMVALSFGFFMVVSLIGTVGVVVPIAVAGSRVDRALRGIQLSDDNKESPDNDRFYKWGMFYYNPDDPAVLVERRFGVGADFNYATWQGKLFIVVLLAVLIGCCALPFVL